MYSRWCESTRLGAQMKPCDFLSFYLHTLDILQETCVEFCLNNAPGNPIRPHMESKGLDTRWILGGSKADSDRISVYA